MHVLQKVQPFADADAYQVSVTEKYPLFYVESSHIYGLLLNIVYRLIETKEHPEKG